MMNRLLSAILFWAKHFVKILDFFFFFFNVILTNFLFLASQFMKLKHGFKNENYWKNEMWQIFLSWGGGRGMEGFPWTNAFLFFFPIFWHSWGGVWKTIESKIEMLIWFHIFLHNYSSIGFFLARMQIKMHKILRIYKKNSLEGQ